MIELLLREGADVNARFDEKTLIENLIFYLNTNQSSLPNFGPRIDLVRSLQRHGADLNATDYLGRPFLEILYWKNRPVPKNEWYWLLKNGTKITKSMISTKFHKNSTIFAVPRKGQLYDPQYTDEDDESMDSLDFVYCMAYHIECQVGHTIFDSDYDNSDGSASSLARRKFTKCRYGGLCDRFRKWYTEEAASAAEEMCPGWFCS
ncbi:hypothetical protein RU639_010626 [Aspergillus parasiticus]